MVALFSSLCVRTHRARRVAIFTYKYVIWPVPAGYWYLCKKYVLWNTWNTVGNPCNRHNMITSHAQLFSECRVQSNYRRFNASNQTQITRRYYDIIYNAVFLIRTPKLLAYLYAICVYFKCEETSIAVTFFGLYLIQILPNHLFPTLRSSVRNTVTLE